MNISKYTCVKIIFVTFSLFLVFSFKPINPKTFQSNNKRVTIIADDSWDAKANMKGVEVFIYKLNTSDNSNSTIVISKDKGLLSETSLEKYSASMIFLQTNVLATTPTLAVLKKINGLDMKMYEYNYSNKELLDQQAIVYHTVIGNTGYQIVITASPKVLSLNRPAFDKIINSIKIN